ncbi:MAG: sugar transferase [Candidatus Omnitrophota bacterium]|jgi:lipopolysaccharide/colanic/teichoic acid biosynthesis glycosyltransferase
MKRAFDFALALFGLGISWPLWLLFSLAIWLEDFGPVFYLQERVGLNAKLFKGVKFRSMKAAADKGAEFLQAEEHDTRVTKFGRFLRITAMDELPQLINILKGEMSFVGPRALVPKEQETHEGRARSVFDFAGFQERSKVRPGLTGVAQVFAARDVSRERKFKYDIWYIKNRTFFLDIRLILLSFLVTFGGRWEIRKEKFAFLNQDLLRRRIESELP